MRQAMKKINLLTILPVIAICANCADVEKKPPNIVIFYADDMGYGDLNIQNPDSKIPTPVLDQLASEGISSGEHSRMPEFFKELRGYTDFETAGLLFNLKEDPEQRINLYEDYPEKVKEMDRLIAVNKQQGYLIKDN